MAVLLKTASVQVSSIQIMQVIVQNKVKSVWKSRYDGDVSMPQKASPLLSSFIGNFIWSYIFIHHMICVLLGALFYFVIICLLLFIIMFCISSFNKNVKDSLYHAYFASIRVAVSKQKVYLCCKNSLEKSQSGITLKLFAY